ncbi:MAG: AbrB/MazE/SpoVT family DNA-binding domain-containing protein [Chloroflexia bacterium]|nr:AbrB/MazE/SpoVT family DNA-binding domain-containing protein [Chloroflexia bacterium]
MPTTSKPTTTTFHAKVTGRHTITLPAELRRHLGIENGDTIELELDGDHAVLRKPVEDPVAALEGILSDYFEDHEDVQRFLEEERSGWEEREAQLEAQWDRAERSRRQSSS